MMRKRRQKGGGRGRGRDPRQWSPQLFIAEGLDIDTADTVTNTTILTQSAHIPVSCKFRSARIGAANGATAAAIFAILRRVPAGYTAPNITVTTGLTSFVDEPDVMAYGYIQFVQNATGLMSVTLRPVYPDQILYEGDLLVFQMVSGTSSVSLVGSAQVEFLTRAE